MASLKTIGGAEAGVDTDFYRWMHGEPNATGSTRGKDCFAFTGYDALADSNQNRSNQNRRRRSSDSTAAGLLTVAAHWSSTLLVVVLVLLVADVPQISTGMWQVLIGGAVMHWAVARFVAGRTFAKLILPIRMHETLNTIPDGLMLLDDQGRIVMANNALLRSLCMRQRDMVGRLAESLPWVRSDASSVEDMPWTSAVRSQEPQGEQLMRFRVSDGSTRFFAINSSPVKTDQDGCQGALVTLRDVTQMESRRSEVEQMLLMLRSSRDQISSKNRELQVLADHDCLTGCLNRRALFRQLDSAWQESDQTKSLLACLMIDVDHFKQVNDLFGHQIGDRVLQTVATVLTEHFEPPALVGRYGGEEFCVLMPRSNLQNAIEASNHVRKQIERTQFQSQPGLCLSVSIGLSVTGEGASTAEDLIRQADECLYLAKKTGRNRVINRAAFLRITQEQSLVAETS
jgi:diguanylate cyclase (GGDEF)-like protein/PAS domain S-box-containing protein